MKAAISHKTPKYSFEIEAYYRITVVSSVRVEKERFSALCKDHCRNFNRKYSCPPSSNDFHNLSCGYDFLHVFLNLVRLDTFPQIYNTIRMVNTVLKGKQRKLTDSISEKLSEKHTPHTILENGSCRLCKTCAFQFVEPCKHPEKMRFSLEATGVDVNDLCSSCFGIPLQWYRKGAFPAYQGVVSAILCNTNSDIVKPEALLSLP